MINMRIASGTVFFLLMAAGMTASQGLAQSDSDAQKSEPPLVSGAMTGVGDGMSEDQIRGFLRAKGYTDLGRFERQGGAFVIDRGKYYGRLVTDLHVDAGTGQVANMQPLDKQQIEVLLRRHGYETVSVRQAEGHDFKVQAKRDGHIRSLKVDTRTAEIQSDCD